jgi:hypothetical protein
VHIPYVCRLRAFEIRQEKVFDFLVEGGRIDRKVVVMIKSRRHTGSSVDNSVRVEAKDEAGMQRLIEYITRSPFSITGMVSLTGDGKILYRASKPGCIPFPKQGDPEHEIGMPRNCEIFDPLDFLAAVTQHIQNKGEHQIRKFLSVTGRLRRFRFHTAPPQLPRKSEPIQSAPFLRRTIFNLALA